MDLDRGRRPGTRDAYQDLIKLTHYFNCIHLAGGYPVEPVDIHASIRHLDCLYDKLTLTDKVVHAYSLGADRVEDVMEMVRIAGGLTHNEFAAQPRMYTNINSSSPLKHDTPMMDGAIRHARKGQPVIVTPFTLAGAMAPVNARRRPRSADRRRAGRRRPSAVRQPWHTGRLWVFHVERRHAHRRTGIRNPRVHAHHPDLRAIGPLLQTAHACLQRLRDQSSGRPGRLGERLLTLGLRHRQGQHHLPCRRLAGGRLVCILRKVRHGLRDACSR